MKALVLDAPGEPAALARMGDELLTMVDQGNLSSMVAEVIHLDAVPHALQRLSQRHVRGKIVARLDR